MKIKFLIVLFVFTFTNIFAQNIDGNWSGNLKINGSNLPIIISIKNSDGKYTSSCQSPKPFSYTHLDVYKRQVRGRYMSEGSWTNMTPQVEHKTKKDVDESTDTYDTIDWLIKNVDNNNKKVGQYGTSYPGFYTAAGILADHPSLVASSPQAPISDFWNDDFLHNGRFMLAYFRTFPVFGIQKTKAEKDLSLIHI